MLLFLLPSLAFALIALALLLSPFSVGSSLPFLSSSLLDLSAPLICCLVSVCFPRCFFQLPPLLVSRPHLSFFPAVFLCPSPPLFPSPVSFFCCCCLRFPRGLSVFLPPRGASLRRFVLPRLLSSLPSARSLCCLSSFIRACCPRRLPLACSSRSRPPTFFGASFSLPMIDRSYFYPAAFLPFEPGFLSLPLLLFLLPCFLPVRLLFLLPCSIAFLPVRLALAFWSYGCLPS